jgi:hypothetical protein
MGRGEGRVRAWRPRNREIALGVNEDAEEILGTKAPEAIRRSGIRPRWVEVDDELGALPRLDEAGDRIVEDSVLQ